MLDPRDTQDHDRDTTIMGPGFFIFFQRGVIEQAGEFADYGTLGERKRKLREKHFDEEEIAPIVERLAEAIVETRQSEADIELMLRLKLEQEAFEFKMTYLIWLIDLIKLERHNKAIILLLLN